MLYLQLSWDCFSEFLMPVLAGTYSLLFFFLILIVFSPIEYYDK